MHTDSGTLSFQFGQPTSRLITKNNTACLSLGNKIVMGTGLEYWSLPITTSGYKNYQQVTVWRNDSELWGIGSVDATGETLEKAASALYQEILSVSQGMSLYRVWNFVPQINEPHDGLDHYRMFCMGRAQAFEHAFSSSGESHMSAASAVVIHGERLYIAFTGGNCDVVHVENPLQVPAYRYPTKYGPRSPSFARASLVTGPNQRVLYVSGTASIRQSESLYSTDAQAQMQVALSNLDSVAQAAGLSQGLNSKSVGLRTIRLYVRHAKYWPLVEKLVKSELVREEDQFNVVEADLCRPELLVEIEAHVLNP